MSAFPADHDSPLAVLRLSVLKFPPDQPVLKERIPSLDGARAVSIALVIWSHLATSGTLPVTDRLWRIEPGNLGVRVFFVISGFLITHLLMKEARNSGRISLKEFYIRRFFRIIPAYWLFLSCVLLAIPWHLVTASQLDIAYAGLYVSNYFVTQMAVAHSWSLAVEEQFYLLWPIIVVVLGWRRATLAAALTLVSAPLFRVACNLGWWPTNPTYSFETVCDAIAVGCLLALLRDKIWQFDQYRRSLNSHYFFALPTFILLVMAARPPAVLWAGVGVSALNITIALTLDRLMRRPDDRVGRILNSRGLCTAGVLSYSIYLWQQLWLDARHPVIFPINVLAIALCATVSYLAVEKPMLRVGRRLLLSLRHR